MIEAPLTTQPDYHSGRCSAITRAGKRCTGRWNSAMCCLFRADPTTGLSTLGPNIVLCHRHAYRSYHPVRVRVVGGWLGAANKHGYGSAVYEHKDGWQAATAWLRHARGFAFGENRSDWL